MVMAGVGNCGVVNVLMEVTLFLMMSILLF